MKWRETTDDR